MTFCHGYFHFSRFHFQFTSFHFHHAHYGHGKEEMASICFIHFILKKWLQAWSLITDGVHRQGASKILANYLLHDNQMKNMLRSGCWVGVVIPRSINVSRVLWKYWPQNHFPSSKDRFSIDHLKGQNCSVDFWLCWPLNSCHLQQWLSPFCCESQIREKCIFLVGIHPTNQPISWAWAATSNRSMHIQTQIIYIEKQFNAHPTQIIYIEKQCIWQRGCNKEFEGMQTTNDKLDEIVEAAWKDIIIKCPENNTLQYC